MMAGEYSMNGKKGYILLEFVIACCIGLVTISLCMYSMYTIIPAYDALLFEGRYIVDDCCMMEQVSEILLSVQSMRGTIYLASQEQGVVWRCADGLDRCIKKSGNKLYSICGLYNIASSTWTQSQRKIIGICTTFTVRNNIPGDSHLAAVILGGKSKKLFSISV